MKIPARSTRLLMVTIRFFELEATVYNFSQCTRMYPVTGNSKLAARIRRP